MNSILLATVLTITQHIYQLESSQGKHDSCLQQNKYNGYGYASNKVCFSSHAEAQGVVYSWVLREYLKGLTTDELLCEYNTGKISKDCDYAKKAKYL